MSTKITVKSKSSNGFWRAGRHFTREGVELDTSKIKKADLEAILNEPNLVVIGEVEDDEKRAAKDLAKKNAAAIARVKEATKSKAGATAWADAEAKAKAASVLDDAAWAALEAFDRIERVEVVIAGAGQPAT